MSRKYLLLGLIIIPLIIAACSGSDDSKEALAAAEASLATAEARAEEAESALASAEEAAARAEAVAEYREQVRFINGRLEEAIRSVSEILDQTYQTKGRLLDVLREANLTETFEGMLASFEQLTPPPGYEPDHQLILKAIGDSVSVSQNRDQTIEDEDLVALVAADTELRLISSRLLNAVSPSLCRKLQESVLPPPSDMPPPPDAPPSQPSLCDSDEPLPAGEYGIQLRSIVKAFTADFGPRVTGFIPALSSQEMYAWLGNIQPKVEALLAETRNKIAALTPPAELASDHDRLIQYFEDTLEVARAITEAAKEADTMRILQVEFPRSGTVLCDALADLSTDIEPIVGFFFPISNPPPFCG